jgi:hypothetical protein
MSKVIKPSDDLVKEAKKYKSADEFVKAIEKENISRPYLPNKNALLENKKERISNEMRVRKEFNTALSMDELTKYNKDTSLNNKLYDLQNRLNNRYRANPYKTKKSK